MRSFFASRYRDGFSGMPAFPLARRDEEVQRGSARVPQFESSYILGDLVNAGDG